MYRLVTVIVPTKNSEETLDICLDSIRRQTYPNIEILVVDNHSDDKTKVIAQKYAAKFYTYGPERSAQVNYGADRAAGDFVYKVDSDFVLDMDVIEECLVSIDEGNDAVVVHNSPDTSVSWIAQVRKFEVDMYKYDITHSSARFVRKDVFRKIEGFNPNITAGEDYDFQNKLNRGGYKTGFIDAEALHLGEPRKLLPHLKKYYKYGKDFVNYEQENRAESKAQLGPIRGVYVKNYMRFIQHPIQGSKFMVYNLLKYSAGGAGFIAGKAKRLVAARSHPK